MNTLQAIYRVD